MKTFIDDTQDWQPIEGAVIPVNADYDSIEVLSVQQNKNPNVPNVGSRISYAKVSPIKFRAVVASGDTTVAKEPPKGFKTSSQYATERALEILSEKRNVPMGIKELSLELNPQIDSSVTPRVSVAAAQADATEDGIFVQLHRSGDVKLFIYHEDDGWKEVLDEDLHSSKAVERIQFLQSKLDAMVRAKSKRYGPNSEEVQALFADYGVKLLELDKYFSSWNCPPIGRFHATARLQKVLANGFHDVHGFLITTPSPRITAQTLDQQGTPKDLDPSFFRNMFGKQEFAASAMAIAR